jgi:hypothetical protein
MKNFIQWIKDIFDRGEIVSEIRFKNPIILQPGESLDIKYVFTKDDKLHNTIVTKQPGNEILEHEDERRMR